MSARSPRRCRRLRDQYRAQIVEAVTRRWSCVLYASQPIAAREAIPNFPQIAPDVRIVIREPRNAHEREMCRAEDRRFGWEK